MSKSDLLPVQDVRAAYRLIGECRDLGSDPALWFPRMLEGVGRLVGASAVTGGEGRWRRPDPSMEVLSAYGIGMDDRARERYAAFMREQGPLADPCFRATLYESGPIVTRARRQLVPDTAWYHGMIYNQYRRPANADHTLMSLSRVSNPSAICVIAPTRERRERDFSAREARLLNLFHEELGPLVGRSLVSATEPSPQKLSPRLRQTLMCLLEGDAEKHVAARLSLSIATTHQYVTAIYRHFRVHSRAQLLAHAIKRIGRDEWRRLTTLE
jgi:DNA-binding CsgD family transcriptional regulator